MNNKTLDTATWKEFRLGDLFEINTGSLMDSKMLAYGNIPRISVKSDNNGILGYYNTTNSYNNARHFKNFISVNFFGDVFYHPYEASVEMKVHVLKLPFYEFTQKVGIYFVGALKRALKAKGFSYGNQLSSSKLRNGDFFITLPIDSKGNLDFGFMESYIKQTKQEMQNIINAYKAIIGGGGARTSSIYSPLCKELKGLFQGAIVQIAQNLLGSLDCEWGEICLVDHFTYERGTRLTKNDRNFGKYPFVTAGEYNKGVKEYIGNTNQKIFKEAITIDMFCNSFVHIDEFCCDDNILVLNPKKQ